MRVLSELVISGALCVSVSGCMLSGGSPSGPGPVDPREAPVDEVGSLPVVHQADPARAERGRRFVHEDGLGGQQVPMAALRNLGWVWGQTPSTEEAYWDMFAERYGFARDPSEPLPLGIEQSGAQAGFNCLACHSDEVAGQVVIGAGNSRLNLQLLYDELIRLNELASSVGYPRQPVGFELEDHTGAPGAYDAFGLSFQLATAWVGNPGVNTTFGYQQPPPWWGVKFKDRLYADASGDARGFRTMMATALAFGQDVGSLQAQAEDYEDLRHYLLSISAPSWPFEAPAADDVASGREVFGEHCARCHGTYDGISAYPGRLVSLDEVGTDPERAARFRDEEAGFVNASWFGADYPMEATGRYLAPPLIGVWATAPYFHNGSVPDLMSVLDSSERPRRWRRVGAGREDYDEVRVGWRTEAASANAEGAYDTDVEGLSGDGHTYGDALSDEARRALIAYLTTL